MIFIQIIIEVLLQIVTITVDIPRRKIFMKKAFLTTFIATLLSCASVNAAMISVDYFSDSTLVTSNNVERVLLVRSDDGENYDISIRPLEDGITGSDGVTVIPLEYLFFNNTKEDVYVRYNEYSHVFYGTDMSEIPRNIVAKIKDFGVVPAGTYTIMLEIQAKNVNSDTPIATTSFALQFVVNAFHEVTTFGESPKLTISATDAFAKNRKIKNEIAPAVHITSNTDWVLSLDPKNFPETAEKWYVKTTSGTSKVNSRLQEYALIIPGGSEIILARGTFPANNESITMEFAVENPEDGVVKEGDYSRIIKYILREGEEE